MSACFTRQNCGGLKLNLQKVVNILVSYQISIEHLYANGIIKNVSSKSCALLKQCSFFVTQKKQPGTYFST